MSWVMIERGRLGERERGRKNSPSHPLSKSPSHYFMVTKGIKITGFQFSGIHAGIKDNPRKKDLSIIFSEEPKTIADGVFTKNRVCAPPVQLCRQVVRGGYAQLIIINSGVANACTGMRGMKDAKKTQKEGAELFGIKPSRVFVSSTGKIGDFLPMKKLVSGLRKAKKDLSQENFVSAAKGIMTTDQYPKFGSVTGKIFGKKYTIAVLAKGAGMLCPNMATMLAYIVTDLKIGRPALKKIFRSAVDQTLNRVTVDGDTSTNDSVIIMANGMAGNKTFSASSATGKKIQKELTTLLEKMAHQITLDGEGATHCCLVKVKGAASDTDAKKIAYAVGNSPLVKTALFGCDPNWGRIMAAVGYSGAKVNQNKINIKIGPYLVAKNGRGTVYHDRPGPVSRYMKKENIEIGIQCGSGKGSFHIYMSDLTYDYVNLNAEYHT